MYGISASFDNETVAAAGVTAGVSGLTPVYPSECDISLSFNQGQTFWLGGTSNLAGLDSIGDRDHVTRVDPIIASRTDVWDTQVDGDAALANGIFTRVTLHGVKLYSVGGSI